ncbi:MAG: hypothetical protein GEU98_14775 [Pseudonocardiaceae bacterium]|nr:hypothetical protein [Pseudonocardiaceae bacterium]
MASHATDTERPAAWPGDWARHFWVGPATEGRLTPGLPSAVAFLFAVWLGFAPFALHYDFPTLSAATDVNDVVVGLVVGVLALARTVAPRDVPWFSSIIAALGGWLVLAPLFLDYSSAVHAERAVVNDVVVGVVLVLLGTAGAIMTYRQRAVERAAGE